MRRAARAWRVHAASWSSLAGLLLWLGAALGVVAAMVSAHRTAQAAADLAALAGATRLADGGDACAEAGAVATANGGSLTSCAVDGRDVAGRRSRWSGRGWLGQTGDLDGRGAGRAGAGRGVSGPAVRVVLVEVAVAVAVGVVELLRELLVACFCSRRWRHSRLTPYLRIQSPSRAATAAPTPSRNRAGGADPTPRTSRLPPAVTSAVKRPASTSPRRRASSSTSQDHHGAEITASGAGLRVGIGGGEQHVEQGGRSALVERVVLVAALG